MCILMPSSATCRSSRPRRVRDSLTVPTVLTHAAIGRMGGRSWGSNEEGQLGVAPNTCRRSVKPLCVNVRKFDFAAAAAASMKRRVEPCNATAFDSGSALNLSSAPFANC